MIEFKGIVKSLFPRLVSVRNRICNYAAHYRFKNQNSEDVFTIIFKENHWKDNESKSGTGSNRKNTQHVVSILNSTLLKFDIKSILDIPCGDFNWMVNVSMNNIKYIGADIVDELIQLNKERFSNQNFEFRKLNVIESDLPTVDLVFCRDCFVHFSYADIFDSIKSIALSNSKYLMCTTFPSHDNYNIITGDWRPINLQKPPFNFPDPLVINNEFTGEDKRYADKSLAVWRIQDLQWKSLRF